MQTEVLTVLWLFFFWILLDLFVDTAVDREVYSNTPHIIKSKW